MAVALVILCVMNARQSKHVLSTEGLPHISNNSEQFGYKGKWAIDTVPLIYNFTFTCMYTHGTTQYLASKNP